MHALENNYKQLGLPSELTARLARGYATLHIIRLCTAVYPDGK
jgi:hypothetical protein